MGKKSSGRNYAVGLRTPYAVWCGSIAVNSDIRIKKDIENVPDNLSLEKLRNIECVYYNYKNEEDNGPHMIIGFIAQQVKQHLPTAVNLKKEVIPNYYKHSKFKITACDENGRIKSKVVGKVDKSVNLDGNTLFYRDSSRDENIHRYPYDCKCSLIDCKKYDEKTEHYFKLTILDDINFKKDILHRFDFITDTMDEEIANTSVVKPMSKIISLLLLIFSDKCIILWGRSRRFSCS